MLITTNLMAKNSAKKYNKWEEDCCQYFYYPVQCFNHYYRRILEALRIKELVYNRNEI